ncbi:MAG: hypothetical protein HRF43_08980 [Phycisphaerae bacterium]
MIRKVVLVVQGENEIGFLEGLRDRLRCDAELVHYLQDHPELRLRSQYTRRQDAKEIFRVHRSADLIVRLTDGDTDQPQNTYQEEVDRWPEESRPLLVCGVCDRDIEHWICIDTDYASRQLGFPADQLPADRVDRSGFIKRRIDEVRGSQTRRQFLSGFVQRAPSMTVRRWLGNRTFAHFYEQCRDKAQQAGCHVENLRESNERETECNAR